MINKYSGSAHFTQCFSSFFKPSKCGLIYGTGIETVGQGDTRLQVLKPNEPDSNANTDGNRHQHNLVATSVVAELAKHPLKIGALYK